MSYEDEQDAYLRSLNKKPVERLWLIGEALRWLGRLSHRNKRKEDEQEK